MVKLGDNGAIKFLQNIGITFAIFKLIRKVPEENDKLVFNDIGLLKAVEIILEIYTGQ